MTEKSINDFVKDFISVFGLENLAIQVKDKNGNVIKQTKNWQEEADFIKADKFRNKQRQAQRIRHGDFYYANT